MGLTDSCYEVTAQTLVQSQMLTVKYVNVDLAKVLVVTDE
eukprot:COSAG05_NODE_22081_length_267_cov_0.619048_1_plen_39_part_01